MSKMRVLQVTGSLRVGGLENIAMNFFRYCDKEEYDFDYVVYGDSVEPFEAEVAALGGRVFHIGYPHKNPMKYLSELRKIMRENGPYDVVHSHSLFNSGLVLWAANKERIPVRIAHGHSDRSKTKVKWFRNLYNRYMRRLINKHCTDRVACSIGAGRYLYGEGYEEQTYISNNGIHVKKYLFNERAREKIKAEWGWENCKIVGHTGRLVEVKNQKKLIDAFSCAYRKDPSLRLAIIGDGDLKNDLQKQIDTLGLSSVAKLFGLRSDVAELLSAFDVYVMPSFYEGVSVALIEAQASGVPCLVSETAAAKETRLTDCINVLSVEDSAEAWGDEMLRLANIPRIENTGSAIVSAGYDITDIVSKQLEMYKEAKGRADVKRKK